MYTSQVYSLRDRDHPSARRTPGRTPSGDTISPSAWQRFHRSIPFRNNPVTFFDYHVLSPFTHVGLFSPIHLNPLHFHMATPHLSGPALRLLPILSKFIETALAFVSISFFFFFANRNCNDANLACRMYDLSSPLVTLCYHISLSTATEKQFRQSVPLHFTSDRLKTSSL
jgi:hypothetical protein